MTLYDLRREMERDPRLRPLSQAQKSGLWLNHEVDGITVGDLIAAAVRAGRLVKARTDGDTTVYAVPTGGLLA